MNQNIAGNEEKYSPMQLRTTVTHIYCTLFTLTFDWILMVVRVHLALMKTPKTYQLWNELISQIGRALFLLPRIRLNVTLNLHFSPYNCVDFLNWNLNNRTNCKKNILGLLKALVFGSNRSSSSYNVCPSISG